VDTPSVSSSPFFRLILLELLSGFAAVRLADTPAAAHWSDTSPPAIFQPDACTAGLQNTDEPQPSASALASHCRCSTSISIQPLAPGLLRGYTQPCRSQDHRRSAMQARRQ
jgi:hypothetical protein